MQCVAVCCSVVQCVAVCCSVLQCVAVCCSVLPSVAVCCSVLQCISVCYSVLHLPSSRAVRISFISTRLSIFLTSLSVLQNNQKTWMPCMFASAPPCQTYGCAMARIWVSHVAHLNESGQTYEWVMSHIWRVMSHIWMSHVTHMNDTHMNESCHISCAWIAVLSLNESWHIYACVMSHHLCIIGKSCNYVNESRPT